jgi:hypothetical protein
MSLFYKKPDRLWGLIKWISGDISLVVNRLSVKSPPPASSARLYVEVCLH